MPYFQLMLMLYFDIINIKLRDIDRIEYIVANRLPHTPRQRYGQTT